MKNMNARTRKEKSVKNYTGIYKEFFVDVGSSSLTPTGRYRAMRRCREVGVNFGKKEQAVFGSFQEAKDFRDFKINESQTVPCRPSLGQSQGLLFEDLVARWKIYHYHAIETSTMETYEKLLPALNWLNKKPVAMIDSEVLSEFGLYLVQSHPRTKRRQSYEKELQVLHVLLTHFRDYMNEGRSYVVPSFKPIRKMTRFVPKVDSSERFLKPHEALKFLDELKKERNPNLYLVALVQYYLGLRISEALGIMVEAVDFAEKTVRICRAINWETGTWVASIKEYPKNQKPRTLPAAEELLSVLRDLVKERRHGLLFLKKDGKPLNRKSISTAFNRVLKRLGYKHVSGTHFIRKTSATHAKIVTGDIDAVSRYLGHSSSRVTRLYVGEIDEQKAQIANGLGRVLNGTKAVCEGTSEGSAVSSVPQRPALQIAK